MKTNFNKLFKNTTILSLSGIISILISLLSIPIHLNYAGPENYGNYIIFHFILLVSINLNFGIGKSTVISMNNFPQKRREISFKGIAYTKNISIFIFSILIFTQFSKILFDTDFFHFYEFTNYFLIGSIITIFFVTFEGILQGNRKFELISLFNLFFFSLSVSIPSILLIYFSDLSLKNLILISITIKFLSLLMMYYFIHTYRLIRKSDDKNLLGNLKKNSKWITTNNLLQQSYNLLDKYLIKIFIGPVAVATYSIPQQLTGKLSILSKSFSAFLLPNLSTKRIDKKNFTFSLKFFFEIIPIIIFVFLPLYPHILEFWLRDSYNENILELTKIFSLAVIFSCASHILITKFEASKTLYLSLKVEIILMPIFLFTLFIIILENQILLQIGLLILFKEICLFLGRLYFLKKEIKSQMKYFIYTFYYLLLIYFSFFYETFYYILLLLLILNFFKNNIKWNLVK